MENGNLENIQLLEWIPFLFLIVKTILNYKFKSLMYAYLKIPTSDSLLILLALAITNSPLS